MLRFSDSVSPRMFLAINFLHRLPPQDIGCRNRGLRLFDFLDGSCYGQTRL
jgi:hypothetical protein